MAYRRIALWGTSLGAVAAVIGACATGTVTFEEDGETSSQAGGTTTGSSGGAGGAATTSTTSEGAGSPCAIDCGSIATPDCQLAQCNEVSGQCQVVNAPDDTSCEDGQFCTVGDACQAGMCIGGGPNDCALQPGDCDDVVCNEATKSCSLTAKGNGAPCTPTDLCQVSATCQNGLCVGSPKDCFFAPVPDDCHVAECNPKTGTCDPVPGNEGQKCVDAKDLCTLSKTCAAGVCQGGVPKDCSGLTQGCVLGVCDTLTGQCTTKNLKNGDACDDKQGCTSGETCQNGTCTGGTQITQCQNGDKCCPAQCSISNDDDCNLCGNNTLELGEEGDPPPGPSSAVPLDVNSCRYDFSKIDQFYCNGTCGNWDGQSDCGQGDADIFCKLKMDNPNSTAVSFQTKPAFAAPGVCCPPPTWTPGTGGCKSIGILSSRGVTTHVSVHDTSVVSTHGAGTVVTQLQCTNP